MFFFVRGSRRRSNSTMAASFPRIDTLANLFPRSESPVSVLDGADEIHLTVMTLFYRDFHGVGPFHTIE